MTLAHIAIPASWTALAELGLGLFVAYWTGTIIYERYFSPLAGIPGPFWYSVSYIPRIIDSALGRVAYRNHDFFEKYGPVVRVEPNFVMLADPKYMKTIYGYGSHFYKTEFYRAFTTFPKDKPIMATMDNREHAKKRALYARCMTKTSILSQQRRVQDRCEALVRGLTSRAKGNGGTVALVGEMGLFAHDVVMIVGLSIETESAARTFSDCDNSDNFLTDLIRDRGQNANTIEAGERDKLSHDLSFGTLNAFLGAFPIINAFFSLIPLKSVQQITMTTVRLRKHGERILREYRSLTPQEQSEYQVFHQLNEDAMRLGYGDTTIINESFSLLAAGGDTTKWLLAYFTYEIFRRPDLLKRLQAEVDDAMPDAETCLEYEAALRLPVFNATIRELLRYYSAVPGPLPRYVPAGEGLIAEGKYFLPPGTQVALQPYTVHRNRDIYGEDADDFNPDRWLRSVDSADVMFKNLLTFGFGSRRCIGYELALLSLTLACACIVRNFEGRVATTGKAAAPLDYFVIYTTCGELKIENMKRRL